MFEKIINLDKVVFVYLNGFGSETFDQFWLLITKQINWAPLFFVGFYFLQKKIGWKNFLYYILFISILILICDQTANLFKETFQRLRPCNDPEIKDIIRIVKSSDTKSFFSGHATNSMATAVFTYLIMRKYFKYIYFLFLFPLIFAYSRIYLGLHFPIDIVTGYAFGATFGVVFYNIYKKYILKTKAL